MKNAVLMAVVLALSTAHRAQGDSPDCATCVQLTDATCTEQANCDNGLDCTSTAFTVPCTGTYALHAEMYCTQVDCHYCVACTHIYAGTRWVTSTHTACDTTCVVESNVVLQEGVDYTLYVCLRSCGSPNCTARCTSCTARGRVQYQDSTCPDW